jgi:hypothetical protein
MGVLGVQADPRSRSTESRSSDTCDTGVHLATRDNMEQPEIKALLSPDLAQWLK